MPHALIGQRWHDVFRNDFPGWERWKNAGQRCAGKTGRTGKALTGNHQKRTAFIDIARHIGEIAHRDNAAAFILIKDDQVEAIQFFFKQLFSWKGDQRHFFKRGNVALIGRPQDREVNQIDRWVGF